MYEQGRDAPELLTPVSIAVVNDGGNRLVYVIDAGYSNRLVSIASVDVSGDLVSAAYLKIYLCVRHL